MTREILGTDLQFIPQDELDSKDLSTSGRDGLSDLATVSGGDNLVQAISMRLSIPRGALAALGHPGYGSRLGELVGKLNNSTTRQMIKLYCQECVRQEPRVKEIRNIEVRPTKGQGRVDVYVQVVPIESDTPLNLVFPFKLEE